MRRRKGVKSKGVRRTGGRSKGEEQGGGVFQKVGSK